MIRKSNHLILGIYTSILLLFTLPTEAQVYFADFENVSKTGYALDTLNINGYHWALREAVIINNASDLKNGLKSVRFRNGKGDTTYMTMTRNKANGLGSLSFQYGRAAFSGDRTGVTPRLVIAYSTDDGQNWLTIDTVNFAGIDTLTPYHSDTLNIPGQIRVRLTTTGGASGKRINIDDLSMTPFVVITHISLIHKTPSGPDITPDTDTLTLHFDHKIEAGNGEIKIYRFGNSAPQIISVPSPQVVITDSIATLRGLQLENASSYYVVVTEGAFSNFRGSLPNHAIDDDTTWTFSTADTLSPTPITTLEENFQFCEDSIGRLGVFRQFSSLGKRVWSCSTIGRADSSAVSMLGGIAEGLSENNVDWLISELPLDLSSMTSPQLSFWQKKRYEGNIERDIRISINYKGQGDPAEATWETLAVQAMTSAPASYWTPVTAITLDAFKNIPFYLAFTYTCATEGAYELFYDDITISNAPLYINRLNQELFQLKVIGDAHPSSILLEISAKEDRVLQLRFCDLSGRPGYEEKLRVSKGSARYTISNTGLHKGFYIIYIEDSQSRKMQKILLK